MKPNKIKLGQLCYPANVKFNRKYDRPYCIGGLVDLKQIGFPAGVLDGEVWLPDSEKRKVDVSNINWPSDGKTEIEYPNLIKYQDVDFGLRLVSYPGFIIPYQEAYWYAENNEYEFIEVVGWGAKSIHPKNEMSGRYIGNYGHPHSLPVWEIEKNFIPLRQSKYYKSDGLYSRIVDQKQFYIMWGFQSSGTCAMAFPDEYPILLEQVEKLVYALDWKALNEDAMKWIESLPEYDPEREAMEPCHWEKAFQLDTISGVPVMCTISINRLIKFQETLSVTTYSPDYKTGFELTYQPEINGYKNTWKKQSYPSSIQKMELFKKGEYNFNDINNYWFGRLYPYWNADNPIIFLSGDFENIEVLKSDLTKYFKKGE